MSCNTKIPNCLILIHQLSNYLEGYNRGCHSREGLKFMNNCAFCQKKVLLKFIMTIYNLRATDIAREINISDSLVRKHISGDRQCPPVDVYIVEKVFGIKIGDCVANGL